MSDWHRVIRIGEREFLIIPDYGPGALLLLAFFLVPIVLVGGVAGALLIMALIWGILFMGFMTIPYWVLMGEADPSALLPFGGFWLTMAFTLLASSMAIKWEYARKAEGRDSHVWLLEWFLLFVFLPIVLGIEAIFMFATIYLG